MIRKTALQPKLNIAIDKKNLSISCNTAGGEALD